jgi:hypothetical protein
VPALHPDALSSNPSPSQKEAINYLMFSFTLDTSEHLPLILSLPLSNTLLFSLHTFSGGGVEKKLDHLPTGHFHSTTSFLISY